MPRCCTHSLQNKPDLTATHLRRCKGSTQCTPISLRKYPEKSPSAVSSCSGPDVMRFSVSSAFVCSCSAYAVLGPSHRPPGVSFVPINGLRWVESQPKYSARKCRRGVLGPKKASAASSSCSSISFILSQFHPIRVGNTVRHLLVLANAHKLLPRKLPQAALTV